MYNVQLAAVIRPVDPKTLPNVWHTPDGKDLDLEFIIRDYVVHMRHHLDQILGAAASMIGNSFGSEIAGPCADFQGLTSLVFRRDFHGAIGTVMSEIARNVGDRVLPADGSGNAWPNLAQIGGSRGKIRLASRDLCDF